MAPEINRVEIMIQRISQISNRPDEIMKIIQEVFDDTDSIPNPGKIYTFIYTAKTPNIDYDKHPLVLVESISLSGFRGYNVHWGDYRNYVWKGVESPFHIIRKGQEFDYLHDVPYKEILST